MKIWFDGGCRPNPGRIETAVVAAGKVYFRDDQGIGDSNDAEWLALLEALKIGGDLGVSEVTLLGDSATVVDHARGASRRAAARFGPYLASFNELAAGFESVRIRRVPRAQNLAGIALARMHARI